MGSIPKVLSGQKDGGHKEKNDTETRVKIKERKTKKKTGDLD